jgi:hypothetical protein
MGSMLRWTIAVAALVGASPLEARAQMSMGSFNGFLTGHVGAITGGEVDEPRLAAGVSVAVLEANGWGAEIDFGHTSDATSGRQIVDATSYMVNGIWMRPAGLVRPFGLAGAGVLQVNGCDFPCNRAARTYDLGLNAGGGVLIMPHDSFGLRADLRYLFSSADHRDLNRPDNFQFWRVSFGATFNWAIAP